MARVKPPLRDAERRDSGLTRRAAVQDLEHPREGEEGADQLEGSLARPERRGGRQPGEDERDGAEPEPLAGPAGEGAGVGWPVSTGARHRRRRRDGSTHLPRHEIAHRSAPSDAGARWGRSVV